MFFLSTDFNIMTFSLFGLYRSFWNLMALVPSASKSLNCTLYVYVIHSWYLNLPISGFKLGILYFKILEAPYVVTL